MLKISLIGARAKFKPLKKPESEIPAVELVTELVEVELQEFSLYVVVCVEYAPFGVADGDMHPRQDLARFLLVIHDESLVGSHRPILLKGCVYAGTVRGDIRLPVRRLFYLGNLGGCFQIVYDLHFYVPHGFRGTPFLAGGDIRETAFSHDEDGSLALAPAPAFQRAVLFVFRSFGGEEAFVYLHVSMKTIACVTLSHHVTELVHHFPYRLVTLASQLTLDFLGRYGTFGRCQKEHGGKPVTDRQLAALHYRAGTERGLMPATAAYPRLVRLVPILVCAATTATAKAMPLAETPKGFHAGFLVRIDIGKIQKCQLFHVHSSLYVFIQKAFLNT